MGKQHCQIDYMAGRHRFFDNETKKAKRIGDSREQWLQMNSA